MRHWLAALFASMTLLSPMAIAGEQPDGQGDPKAKTCMTGEKPTDSMIPLKICFTNAQWAEMKQDGIVIGPDGRPVSHDPNDVHGALCTRVYTGGGNPNGLSPNFNVVCN